MRSLPSVDQRGSPPARGPSGPARGRVWFVTGALLLPLALSGCGEGDDDHVTVTVGYQSKTINTVTAGTLLRSLGYFERELRALGRRDGRTYEVEWQDYATGAPITAQMTAGKVDIGSMGDFPLLINAARGEALDAPTKLVSVTGYNPRGGLNTVVAPPDSPHSELADLADSKVSTSVGSAADGTLIRALERSGAGTGSGPRKLNQEPAVGASAMESGSVDALSQFVAWPGLLSFQGKAKPLYDGARLGLPTFHGVAVRAEFGERRSGVVRAFLRAQQDANDYLNDHPLRASRKVAGTTGLPAEVVHLYNGPNGIATFDPTLKPRLVSALEKNARLLRRENLIDEVDVGSFVDDRPAREALGSAYTTQLKQTAQRRATSEVWLRGERDTRQFDSPTRALRFLAAHRGRERAGYVPDTVTGTRWFADRAVWVRSGAELYPFTTVDTARTWLKSHPEARRVSYQRALREAAS